MNNLTHGILIAFGAIWQMRNKTIIQMLNGKTIEI